MGGKWRSAPRYPQPRYQTIIEPFAGSAGYSLRYVDRDVILIDKDEIIAGTWHYLVNVREDEIRGLPLLTVGQSIDDFNLTQEQRWLIGWWLNKGTTMPCKTQTSWALVHPNSQWGSAIRERIASSLCRIRHWKIIHGDYADAPDIEATWFIDPPYIKSPGNRYRYGNSGISYEHLNCWSRSRKGQAIVCENDGADWLPFQHFADIKGKTGHRRTGVSHEAIWCHDLSTAHSISETGVSR